MNKTDLKIFKKIPVLETDRLILRKISLNDLNDVFEYSSDPAVSEYLLWSAHNNIGFTKLYLKTVEKFYRSLKFYDWAVVHKEDKKMIGTVGFTSIDIENNCAEIGYVLNSKYWGRALAVEAINAILKFAFEELRLHRVEARYMIENIQSKRVLEKCNMNFDGIVKDAIKAKGVYRTIGIFSITEEEFLKSNI